VADVADAYLTLLPLAYCLESLIWTTMLLIGME
jgi:hypothetical protein